MGRKTRYNLDITLAAIIRELLRLDLAIELTRDTRLRSGLHMDSLDHVELVMELEDEFSIHIPDAEALRWMTYGDIHDSVKLHANAVFAVVSIDEKIQVTSVSSKGDYEMTPWAGELYKTWKTFGGACAALGRLIDNMPIAQDQLKVKEVLECNF